MGCCSGVMQHPHGCWFSRESRQPSWTSGECLNQWIGEPTFRRVRAGFPGSASASTALPACSGRAYTGSMETSSSGVTSRLPAVVLALLVVCAGGAWYLFRASIAAAGPAPAPAHAAASEASTALPAAAAASVVERSEAPATTPTAAVPSEDAPVDAAAPAPEAAAVVHGRVV